MIDYYCQYCGCIMNGKTCGEAEKHVNRCLIKANKIYQERAMTEYCGQDPYITKDYSRKD